MAAARPHHHVLVFLQDDVGVVVEVEHRYGVELGRGAAGLRHVLGVHQVHLVEERRDSCVSISCTILPPSVGVTVMFLFPLPNIEPVQSVSTEYELVQNTKSWFRTGTKKLLFSCPELYSTRWKIQID